MKTRWRKAVARSMASRAERAGLGAGSGGGGGEEAGRAGSVGGEGGGGRSALARPRPRPRAAGRRCALIPLALVCGAQAGSGGRGGGMAAGRGARGREVHMGRRPGMCPTGDQGLRRGPSHRRVAG